MSTLKFPTYTNPEMLDEKELREELWRMNQQNMLLTVRLHDMVCLAQRLSELLRKVVEARVSDDHEGVNGVLDEIIEHNVQRGKDKARVH